MAQHYSDETRAEEPTALPDLETFYVSKGKRGRAECPVCSSDDLGSDPQADHAEHVGWYWWVCFPGCLPDSEPMGPFASEAEALADARGDEAPDDDETPVGTCPACRESVFNSREPDGPVWTCPADLSPENPYYEPPLPPFDTITEEQRGALGYFGNCREDGYAGAHGTGCYERMPLHSACYDKGNY